MPAEVISLLSSSPVGPSPAAVAASSESNKRSNPNVPQKALDYDLQVTTKTDGRKNAINPACHTASGPAIGIKRASSYQTRHEAHADYGSLFLSNDFDTTGDLDASFHKKPRTSIGLSHHRKQDHEPVSPGRTRCTTAGSLPQGQLQPMGGKRWGNMVEDIDLSSSPADLIRLEATQKAHEISSDPFASPHKGRIQKAAPLMPASKNPSSGSPKGFDKHGGRGTWTWPAKLRGDATADSNHEPQRSSKATFIDLSSDSIDSPLKILRGNRPSTCRRTMWDPISSSAPETHDIQDLLSSPPIATGAAVLPQLISPGIGDFSDSDDLPALDDISFPKIRATMHSHSSASRPRVPAQRQAMKEGGKSADEKLREKKQKLEEKEAEKARKHTEKMRVKEDRAQQREKEKALAEVNKLRTDKKVSTPEMIVDIPASANPSLKIQIETLLGDLNVQHESWNSTVGNVIKWRRKVTSEFDEEMGLWKPTPMRVKDEDHILVIVQAAEFVKLALGEEGQDLEAHILQMESKFPDTKPIYLIEGLAAWIRKNRNFLNRQFASAVRNLGGAEPGPSSGQSRRRNNNQPQEYVDEDKVEDALLSLQVLHGTLVHHTNAPVETAQWVAVFTQHISTIPYRKARDASADAGFCMDSGQVRAGDGAKDTYIHMLETIARVTSPVAYGIAAKYESVTDLVRGLKEEGPLALANCRKSANKDGAFTDRTIGPAISKRIHKIFLGRDPTSTDI
ncbi:ERCC4 domain-containing protein [Xylaria palmicola]|nr:ERCC4 domain-containing protein [Xylaria palmicola]